MKQAVNEALISESIFDYEKMKEVACTYSANKNALFMRQYIWLF